MSATNSENLNILEVILAGNSSQARYLKNQVERVSVGNAPALIIGEPGAGKLPIARLVHDTTGKGGKFIAYLVSEQTEEDLKKLLKRHATKGANSKASLNTLYIDDVADFSLSEQKRLAAFLKAFEGRSSRPKVITATSQDLPSLVKYNAFSRELYWLLNVQNLSLPNLQHRRGDIPLIVRRFMRLEYAPAKPPEISEKAMNALVRYAWPGNLREMRNVVTRLHTLGKRRRIIGNDVRSILANPLSTDTGLGRGQNLSSSIYKNLEKYFKAHDQHLPPDGLYNRILKEVERPLISLTLNATGGNQLKAAKLLGLNRNTLRKKLKNLDIDAKDLKT